MAESVGHLRTRFSCLLAALNKVSRENLQSAISYTVQFAGVSVLPVVWTGTLLIHLGGRTGGQMK